MKTSPSSSIKKKKKEKLIIGTLDKADFPEWGLQEIDCKIDTGAQTSAIHCHGVKVIEKKGREVLIFKLLDPTHPAYNHKPFEYTEFKERIVKNSFGESEERYVIRAKILLFGQLIETEFTLADRMKMKYPILLGKKLLRGRFLVDVAKKNLSWKAKNKMQDIRHKT